MSMVHTDAVFFEDDKAFETWLVHNASTATHVWVRMAKKGAGVTSIDWTRAVDVALCFGWIDGISRRIDDEWYVQRFTPRRAKSVWSKINRERIERLTAEGRMRPAGLAEVERAKADGRWAAAYDSPATAVVPGRPRRRPGSARAHRGLRRTGQPKPLRLSQSHPNRSATGDPHPPHRTAHRRPRPGQDPLPGADEEVRSLVGVQRS